MLSDSFPVLGRTLSPITQDACIFYDDHILYSNFAGVVLDSEEGKEIAAALGSKRAALLGSHGLLTVGKSVEEATALFIHLDRCCQTQIHADASSAGSGKPLVMIGEEEAIATHKALGHSRIGYCKLDWNLWTGKLLQKVLTTASHGFATVSIS